MYLKYFISLLGCLVLGIIVFIIMEMNPRQEELALIINMENQRILPRNFRTTEKTVSHATISLEGLKELKSSASGQFSELSLSKMLEVIPADKILLIDLREESHGFMNGIAVSWYGENDWSNQEKDVNEIQQDEQGRLQKALQEKEVLLYQKNSLRDNPLMIRVNEAYTEKLLAQKKGVQYQRLPVTDHLRPTDERVGQFIALMKDSVLNPAARDWVHFHCSAGRGRSTTFIAMYDMMNNANKASFEDILARQALIGGKDLAEPFEKTDWRYEYHFERLEFLKNFYNYCKENPNFEQSWTFWIKR